jgi:hypothetical protein
MIEGQEPSAQELSDRLRDKAQSAEQGNVTPEPLKEPIENLENNQAPEAQVETLATETPVEVNKYEGYVSPEQLEVMKQEWQEQNKSTQHEYSERAKKLIELDSKGVDLTEKVIKYSNTDFDTVDTDDVNTAMDIIEQALMDVHSYNSEQIDVLMQKDYPDLYRDIDEDDEEGQQRIRTQTVLAQIEAKKAIERLKGYQKEVMLPPKAEMKSNEPTKEQIELQRKQIEAYQVNASKALDGFSNVEFKLSDDVNITVDATQDNMGDVAQLVSHHAHNVL